MNLGIRTTFQSFQRLKSEFALVFELGILQLFIPSYTPFFLWFTLFTPRGGNHGSIPPPLIFSLHLFSFFFLSVFSAEVSQDRLEKLTAPLFRLLSILQTFLGINKSFVLFLPWKTLLHFVLLAMALHRTSHAINTFVSPSSVLGRRMRGIMLRLNEFLVIVCVGLFRGGKSLITTR